MILLIWGKKHQFESSASEDHQYWQEYDNSDVWLLTISTGQLCGQRHTVKVFDLSQALPFDLKIVFDQFAEKMTVGKKLWSWLLLMVWQKRWLACSMFTWRQLACCVIGTSRPSNWREKLLLKDLHLRSKPVEIIFSGGGYEVVAAARLELHLLWRRREAPETILWL